MKPFVDVPQGLVVGSPRRGGRFGVFLEGFLLLDTWLNQIIKTTRYFVEICQLRGIEALTSLWPR